MSELHCVFRSMERFFLNDNKHEHLTIIFSHILQFGLAKLCLLTNQTSVAKVKPLLDLRDSFPIDFLASKPSRQLCQSFACPTATCLRHCCRLYIRSDALWPSLYR
jgi:hypothetical protein